MGRAACSRLSGIVMFSWFEKALAADGAAGQSGAAGDARRLLLALRAPGQGAVRRPVRDRLCGRTARRHHPGLHRQGRDPRHHRASPTLLFAQSWHLLVGMALVLLVARPLALTAQNIVANQAIAANVTNLIRWQSHWHVVRQSWAFFQNDFAGRIANKVMQTGPAIRQSLVSMITAVWYILVYGTSAMLLLGSADPWLALADPGLVCGLRRAAADFRAAHARYLGRGVGSTLDPDRPHRRHLYQYPDAEAVRARARRGCLCPQLGRDSIPACSTPRFG